MEIQEERETEPRERFTVIISPASGIRRPSYNGAPAMAQACLAFPLSESDDLRPFVFHLSCFSPRPLFEKFNYAERSNVRGRAVPAPLETLNYTVMSDE